MEGLDTKDEEKEEVICHEETEECKVINGDELHSIQAVKFEERTEAKEEDSRVVNVAALLLLKGKKRKRRKERRGQQVVKAGIG